MRTTTIDINANALMNNITQITQIAPTAKLMLMYKANAYGHGLQVCTQALLNNPEIAKKVNSLGVATLKAGLELRALGWHNHIALIEGVFDKLDWQTAIEHNMQCVIHHQQQLDWALQHKPTKDSATNTIWLKYNTGMNRLGFSEEAIVDVSTQLHNAGYQLILTSHFANADDIDHPLNEQQGQAFDKKLMQLRELFGSSVQGSLCNSAGLVRFPQWHYDWVRAGIMVYGSSPVNDQTAEQLKVQAVMRFSCQVIAIHQLKQGEQVGYGSIWTAQKDSRIAVLSVGYGDGYPRVVNEQTPVVVHGNEGCYKCPIIGRVAMDMTMIDISHVNPECISINDHVSLWGDSLHIDEIADYANTISYELMCRLTTRPKRNSDTYC